MIDRKIIFATNRCE